MAGWNSGLQQNQPAAPVAILPLIAIVIIVVIIILIVVVVVVVVIRIVVWLTCKTHINAYNCIFPLSVQLKNYGKGR